jgi:hypothetical protein
MLRQDQGDQVVAGQEEEGCAVHASPRIDPSVTVSRDFCEGGEQLRLSKRSSVAKLVRRRKVRSNYVRNAPARRGLGVSR